MNRYRGIVDVAWKKSAEVVVLARTNIESAGEAGSSTYERSSDAKAPKPRNFVYAVT